MRQHYDNAACCLFATYMYHRTEGDKTEEAQIRPSLHGFDSSQICTTFWSFRHETSRQHILRKLSCWLRRFIYETKRWHDKPDNQVPVIKETILTNCHTISFGQEITKSVWLMHMDQKDLYYLKYRYFVSLETQTKSWKWSEYGTYPTRFPAACGH